jgi:hypothetical protein
MPAGFHVERLRLGTLPARAEGFALVLLEGGELRARCQSGDTWSLAAGDLLVLGPGAEISFTPRRGVADLILLRAQGGWLAQALALAGFELDPAPPRTAALRAGIEAAKRAALPASGFPAGV